MKTFSAFLTRKTGRKAMLSLLAGLILAVSVTSAGAYAKSLDEIIGEDSSSGESQSTDDTKGEQEIETKTVYETPNPEAEKVVEEFTTKKEDGKEIEQGPNIRVYQTIKDENTTDDTSEEDGEKVLTYTPTDAAEWIIQPGESRYTRRTIDIGADVTRIEVFYTSGCQEPELIFTSPGENIYYSGQDASYENTVFETRRGYKVTGHEDISYYVIYFSNMTDYGTWQMEASIDDNTKEFFVIKARVPQKWKDLNVEYRTKADEAILWYLADDSKYTSSEEIQAFISEDAKIPDENEMKTVVHEPPPKKDPISIVLILVLVAIPIVGAGIYLIFRKMNLERKEHTKEKILSDNQRLHLHKKEENERLDQYFDNNRYDYSDDFDIRKRAVLAKERVSTRNNADSEIFRKEQERLAIIEEMPDFVDEDFIESEVTKRFSEDSDLDEMINFDYSEGSDRQNTLGSTFVNNLDDLDDLDDDFELEEIDDDIELEELEEDPAPIPAGIKTTDAPNTFTAADTTAQNPQKGGGPSNGMIKTEPQEPVPSFFADVDDDEDDDEFF